MSLENKQCTPCKGGIPPMPENEAREFLKQIPNWSLEENASCLVRSFKFKNYLESFSFIADVSRIAEVENHHPDITFGWGYATILIRTHKINGLHENDFILAAKINQLVEGYERAA